MRFVVADLKDRTIVGTEPMTGFANYSRSDTACRVTTMRSVKIRIPCT